MFRGNSKVTLDSKGRMAIPTRFRDDIVQRCGGSLVASMDSHDPCLLLYPLPDWEGMERRLMRLSGNKRSIRRYQRRILGQAFEMDMDGHGRILIPRELRSSAALDRQAILIGQGSRFELWDEEHWKQWLEASSDEDLDDLPPELESLLL